MLYSVQYNAKYCTHVMSIGGWKVWKVAHIACIYAKATKALELRHRQDLYSAKAVGELHVQLLQSIKSGSVSVRRVDSKT